MKHGWNFPNILMTTLLLIILGGILAILEAVGQ